MRLSFGFIFLLLCCQGNGHLGIGLSRDCYLCALDLLRNIRTQVLIKLIEPYTRVRIPFMSQVSMIFCVSSRVTDTFSAMSITRTISMSYHFSSSDEFFFTLHKHFIHESQ